MKAEESAPRPRQSKQREIILEELRKLTSHPRSDELYALVRKRLPSVSLGTVYRNLDRLRKEGMALEIYCGEFVRYDGNVMPHDHFMCRVCRRVWDFESPAHWHQRFPTPEYDARGFHVEGSYTVFYGTCPDCLRKAVY